MGTFLSIGSILYKKRVNYRVLNEKVPLDEALFRISLSKYATYTFIVVNHAFFSLGYFYLSAVVIAVK